MSFLIKTILVDDHSLILKGFTSYFKEKDGRVQVIETMKSAEMLFEILRSESKPNIVLLDIEIKGGMSGVEALRALKKDYPEINVIMISSHFENSLVIGCIKAGAAAYLSKDNNFEVIEKAICEVADNGFYHCEKVSALLGDPVWNGKALSQKETEVLMLICQGLKCKEIKDALGVTEDTVDYHRKNIFRKTGCKNEAQLGIYAKSNCLLMDGKNGTDHRKNGKE